MLALISKYVIEPKLNNLWLYYIKYLDRQVKTVLTWISAYDGGVWSGFHCLPICH